MRRKSCGTCGHLREGRCEISKQVKAQTQEACRMHATRAELGRRAKRRVTA